MPIKPDICTRIWRLWCQGYDAKTASVALLATSLAGLLLGAAFVISIVING